MSNHNKRNDFKKINSKLNHILVDKSNFFEAMQRFKSELGNKNIKYACLHNEFSNGDYFSQMQHLNHELTEATNFIEIIRQMSLDLEGQILWTEISLCDDEKVYSTFLIPSMKFKKFQKESYLPMDTSLLQYLRMNPNYNFESLFSSKTLSYMNLEDKSTIEENLKRILDQGKPSKKENKKSYYFYPKNVVLPNRRVQDFTLNIIKSVYEKLKVTQFDQAYEEFTPLYEFNSRSLEEIECINSFDWKKIVGFYDAVKLYLRKIDIRKSSLPQCEDFFAMINKLKVFLQSKFPLEDNQVMTTPVVLAREFYQDLRRFLENFLSITIELTYSEVLEWKFKLIKKEIIQEDRQRYLIDFLNLILTLEGNDVVEIPGDQIEKNSLTNTVLHITTMFPEETRKYLEANFSFTITANVKNFSKTGSTFTRDTSKFTYENLFLNIGNEKEILFDYPIESEIYLLLEDISNTIDTEDSEVKRVNFRNKCFFKDFSQLMQLKPNLITTLEPNLKNFKLNTDSKMPQCSFRINGQLKLTNTKNLKNDLLEEFLNYKKELTVEEEFGVANFYKILLDAKEIRIIGVNLLTRMSVIHSQIFFKGNIPDLHQFLCNVNDLHDLRYLSKVLNFNLIQKLNQFKIDCPLISRRYYEIFKEISKGNQVILNSSMNMLPIYSQDYNKLRVIEAKSFRIIEKTLNQDRTSSKFMVKAVDLNEVTEHLEDYNLIVEDQPHDKVAVSILDKMNSELEAKLTSLKIKNIIYY